MTGTKIPHNTGLIVYEQPNPTDYIRGIASGIELIERIDGDWSKYRSVGEKQSSAVFDSMACVSFSFNNAIEEQINWMVKTVPDFWQKVSLLLTADEFILLKDFFNSAGDADLSDRALAKLSGTSKDGNSLSWVSITGRNFAVPEKAWRWDQSFNWDQYYAPIPQELVKKYTDVFFKVFNIKSEWIQPKKSEIAIHLKHAPIQVASGVCPVWGVSDPIKACGRHNEHATVIDRVSSVYSVYDHYTPFGKHLALDYNIDAALKLIVSINKPISNTMVVKENYLYQLVEGHGGFALGLNGNLIIDDVAKILASWLVRNNGNTTGKTVAVLQKDWDSIKHYDLGMNPVP